MKTFFFLLSTMVLGFAPGTSFSQAKIIIDADKKVTIHEVFRIIKNQTEYRFIYPEDLFENAPDVKLKKGSISLNKLLIQSLSNDGFIFKLEENNIVISKEDKQVKSIIEKQQSKISGQVSDHTGIPLIGVNIIVKGTSRGTQTDFDGNYDIMATKGEVLVFSYIGFEEHEKLINDETVINVVLKELSSALDEVVISAYGRVMTRNESTSSITSVSSDDLTKQSFTDATQSLQGKVPGLTVQATSGTPGSSNQVRIRGMNSITASNDPLYVIDGIPLTSGNVSGSSGSSSPTIDVFSLINTHDIEQISVLKDASAVAPYGAEGANGVILITTKSGREGKAQFNLNINTGIQNYASEGPKMMNAEQMAEAVTNGVWNSFGTGTGNGFLQSMDQAFGYAKDRISQLRIWDEVYGRPDTDWKKIIRRKDAPVLDVDFSVRQGDEKHRFFGSLGFNKTIGTNLGSQFQRWSGMIKYETDLTNRISLKLGLNVANASQDGTNDQGALSPFDNANSAKYLGTPLAKVYNDDGTLNIENYSDITTTSNMLYIFKHDIRNNDVTRAIPRISLDFKLTNDLIFRTVLGMDYTLTYSKHYQNPNHGIGGVAVGGNVTEDVRRIYHYTSQNSLDYKLNFNDKHNIRLTVLQEWNKTKDNLLGGHGKGFPNDELKSLSSTSAAFSVRSTYEDQMSIRYVGLLNYNFDVKYLLDASLTYQGDSRFNDKYDWFYSTGLGWNLHKEDFIKNSSAIDVLRLKLGYGLTGNAGIGINQYQPLLGYNVYNSNNAAYISGYGTTASWEKSQRLDISVDFEFLNRRLAGSLGAYFNTTTDMLFQVPLPISAGFKGGSIVRNAGEMTNSGIEFALTTNIISISDFNWSASANIATFRNEVSKLDKDAEIRNPRQIVQQDHKVYEWYLKEWAGVNPDNGLPEWYVDRSKNEEITNDYSKAERQYTGYNAMPTYNGSISTRLDYKKAFVEATLFFEGGHMNYDIRPYNIYNTNVSAMVTLNGALYSYENAWREPGDITDIPRFDYNNTSIANAAQSSTRFLYDGDYIRLRDIAIGYTFDSENATWLSALGINKLNLSVRGTNLWTWVKDKRTTFDPERSFRVDTGSNNFRTPPSKQIMFNLNFNF